MDSQPDYVSKIRVFVSSPGDVADERRALDEAIDHVNDICCKPHRTELKLYKWEDDVIPQIGPGPQEVVDAQMPSYDIYIGIMSSRFGTPTQSYGSGTEQEFNDARERWGEHGKPWILFYFHENAQPQKGVEGAEQWVKVQRFRKKLEELGIIKGYSQVRGDREGFYEQVSGHLGKLVQELAKLEQSQSGQAKISKSLGTQKDSTGDEYTYLSNLIEELRTDKGEVVFDYVELSAQAHTSAKLGTSIAPGLGHIASANIQLQNIEQAVDRFSSFVIAGDPGAGKTTTLRYLALKEAQRCMEAPGEAALPVYVSLSKWQEDNSPIDFLSDILPMEIDLLTLLKNGQAAVFLDGLDEMGAQGEKKAKILSKWLDDNVKRVVVTCRIVNYIGNLKLNLPLVTLKRLDDTQISKFVHSYLPESAEQFSKQLFSEQEEDEDKYLTRLKRNPYYLTALILVYKFSDQQKLPQTESELFPALVKALWKREEEKQSPGWIPFNELASKFSRLAFAVVDEDQPTSVPLDWVMHQLLEKRWIDAISAKEKKDVLELLKVANDADIIRFTDDKVTFFHQLVQEYFAAEGLKRATSTGMVEGAFERYLRLEPGDDGNVTLDYGRYAGKWDQVVVALCGLSAPDTIVQHVLRFDPQLAAHCINSGANVSMDTKNMVLQRILEALVSPGEKDAVWTGADVLDDLKESFLKGIPDDMLNSLQPMIPTKDQWIRSTAVRSISYLGETAVDSLLNLLSDRNADIKLSAAIALFYIGMPSVQPVLTYLQNSQWRSQSEGDEILKILAKSYPEYFNELIAKKKEAISTSPEDAVLYTEISYLHMALDQNSEALGCAQHAAATLPENVDLRLLIGDLCRRLERFADAKDAFHRAIELDPEYAEYYLQICLLFETEQKYDDGIAFYRDACQKIKDTEILHLWAGTLFLIKKQDFSSAEEAFKAAIDVNPNSLRAKAGLGTAYLYQERYEEALDFLKSAVAHDPKVSAWQNLYGLVLMRLRKYDEAIETYENAILLEPDLAEPYIRLAAAYHAAGNSELALSVYQRSLEKNPDDVVLMTELSRLLNDFAEYERAWKLLEKVTQIDDSYNATYSIMLWSLQHLGPSFLEKALNATRKALELDSEDLWAHKELGNILSLLDRRDEAEKEYEWVINHIGTDGQRAEISTLGWCHYCLGQYSEAIRYFRDDIADRKDQYSSTFDLALCLMLTDEYNEALNLYREGIDNSRDKHVLDQRGWLYVALFDLQHANFEPPEHFDDSKIQEATKLLKFRLQEVYDAFDADLQFIDTQFVE